MAVRPAAGYDPRPPPGDLGLSAGHLLLPRVPGGTPRLLLLLLLLLLRLKPRPQPSPMLQPHHSCLVHIQRIHGWLRPSPPWKPFLLRPQCCSMASPRIAEPTAALLLPWLLLPPLDLLRRVWGCVWCRQPVLDLEQHVIRWAAVCQYLCRMFRFPMRPFWNASHHGSSRILSSQPTLPSRYLHSPQGLPPSPRPHHITDLPHEPAGSRSLQGRTGAHCSTDSHMQQWRSLCFRHLLS